MSEEHDVEMAEGVGENEGASDTENPHLEKLRFRNYKPRDPLIAACILEPPPLPTMVHVINEKLTKIEMEEDNDDILSLAPKKANWDLKRDLEKNLGILDRRTQRAIVELASEKLK